MENLSFQRSIAMLLIYILSIGIIQAQKSKEDYLKEIHEGALCFRMKTNLKKMQALRDANQLKESELLKIETAESIGRWREAFRTHYDFGVVYLFNDYDGYSITEGDIEGKLFDLDGNMVKNYTGPIIVIGLDDTPQLDLEGLILLDQNMEQLPKNTPNYVSAYKNLRTTRKTEAEMVIELNEALHKRLK